MNQTGSVLFILLLGKADISKVVPIANAASILFNALVDLALGESYYLAYLLPGLALVASGVGGHKAIMSCALPTQPPQHISHLPTLRV
mmetsp:Transcript_19229/g.41555  ORF Transcript_19229/g.41555 Transcript_19229/m.41555 type:complete len:88 (-) Transcript_19229:1082-1345(-)